MILMRVDRSCGSSTFIADTLEREGETWTATGRWKYSSGRLGDLATYTWPVAKVHEIRHDYVEGGAL